eukprot:TRINITY_DN12092_c0_g1_i1.p1 TRINITY_DN12092_c0_g1~~TRINITY_DN12092_c0_g1_i1.p1  ORF type:complete len:645 (-),score=91.80 TRINITY_DN12092_c0_g1_i1:1944-3878(-)
MRLLVALCCLLGVATAVGGSRSVAPLPAGWKVVGKAAPHQSLSSSLLFSLKKRNIPALAAKALDVSTPSHVAYGQHLSADELRSLIAPTPETFSSVIQWLEGEGLVAHPVPGSIDLIEVATPSVQSAEKALGTRFAVVHHPNIDGLPATVTRAVSPIRLPDDVAHLVAAVYGPFALPIPRQRQTSEVSRGRAASAAQGGYVTPTIINLRYNVTGSLSGSASNQQAVAEFQGQWMEASDLQKFFAEFVPDHTDCDKVTAFKGDKQSGKGVEALLDIEYIMGVAPCAKTEFWGYTSTDFCADVKKWTAALVTESNARVHSVSYGFQGDLLSIGCSTAELQDIDASFSALAARGFSMIVASGDSGSNCAQAAAGSCETTYDAAVVGDVMARLSDTLFCCDACTKAAGCVAYTHNIISLECTLHSSYNGTKPAGVGTWGGKAHPATGVCWPSWPASSPWVTSVGATAQDQNGGEMASSQFGSGGGFAHFGKDGAPFPRPQYQSAAVDTFFKHASPEKLPPTSWYDVKQRATPDVSAFGEAFAVIVGGSNGGVGGTSAATPLFAALVTRLNEIRIVEKKKAPLGFLNPFLYGVAANVSSAFYDVTEGSNGIDRSGNSIPGFPAVAGWDPATGLGTPNFRVLARAVADLP